MINRIPAWLSVVRVAGLAVWLLVFDIARHTAGQHGLTVLMCVLLFIIVGVFSV